jgi:hypothetical protein
MATETLPAPSSSPNAPAPTPTAPPARSVAPAATPSPKADPNSSREDAFAALDKLASESEATPNPAEDTPTPGGDTPLEKPETPEPGDEPADKPDDAKPQLDADDKLAPKPLRERLKAVKKEKSTLEAKVKELEAQVAAKATEKPEETKKLTETLAEREKRLAELEEHIRFTNYEQSDEYKSKYWTPYVEAIKEGQNLVAGLAVAQPDGETRAGTPQDFIDILKITNDSEAVKKVVELFGDQASLVLNERRAVQKLNKARDAAIEDYRKNGAERMQQREAQARQQHEALITDFDTSIKAGAEKYPQWFKPVEGDEKGNALLEQGRELANIAFKGVVKDPKTGQERRITPQQQARYHAAMFNKAAGFDRQVYVNAQLQKQVATLKKELADFRKSEPGAGDPPGKRTAPRGSSMDEAMSGLNALAR